MARILNGKLPCDPPPPGSGNGNSPVCAAWIAFEQPIVEVLDPFGPDRHLRVDDHDDFIER